MLVLTRKRFEMIQIGDSITVKVIRTGRNAVKIGIEAPANVRVLRGELSPSEAAGTGEQDEETLEDDLPEELELALACSDQFPHPHLF